MKKNKIILFILFFLLFILNINIILYAHNDEHINITITTYFTENNKITNTITGNNGSKLSLDDNLLSIPGYEFSFWILNGEVKDLPIDNEFIVNEEMDLIAVFKPLGKYVVLFMDKDYGLLDIQYVSPGEDVKDPDIVYPDKPNYKISKEKWDKSLKNINDDTIINLLYEKINQNKYLLEVYGGKIVDSDKTSEFITYNDIITIEAFNVSDKYFKYWMIDNRIISTQRTYSFTILKDTTIRAIYDEKEKADFPLVNLSEALSIYDGYNSFKGQYYLPIGYTLIEYGIIASSEDGIIDLDSQNISKREGQIYETSTNEWISSFPVEVSTSARAYLICKDENENIITVYNETYEEKNLININVNSTNTPRDELKNIGWDYLGLSSTIDYWEFKSSNTWIETEHFEAIGPLVFTMNAVGTGTFPSNTFKIEAFNDNGDLIETSGNISITDAGIHDQSGSNYNEFSYNFTNTNNDINYLRLTYNKETSGTNLRVKSINISLENISKQIKNINTTLSKTSYFVDDKIDLNDAYIKIDYIDGTSIIESLNNENIIDFNTSTSGEFSFIVYYRGHIDIVNYTVNKKEPNYEVPIIEDIKYYEGLKLNDIELPNGFSWNEPNTLLNLGESEHYVTYTPDNTNKYKIITDIIVKVNVVEEIIIPTPIIIYEIYGGGGNSGATYTHDFVILYNNTHNDIDLSGYSLQYASSTSTNYQIMELSGIIKAKNYFLIQLASNNNEIGSPLPINGNISFNTNISATSGKIALVDSLEGITTSKHSSVIDFVGYGQANDSETNPTNTLSATTSAKRNSFIDTNDNANDFTVSNVDLTYLVNNLDIIGISVKNLRSYYQLNDELDLTNALLILLYSNGSTIELPLVSEIISGFDSSNYGEFELTITFGQFTTTHPYYIVDYSSLDEAFVYYIDIGATGGKAGEAALIKVGNIEILIDSGDDDDLSEDELLDFLATKVMDNTIEYVIATHPDSDHIGGMDVVYEYYLVENSIVYSTNNQNPSNVAIEFMDAVNLENTNIYYIDELVNSNPIIELTEAINLRFYDTSYLTSDDKNASSIVFTLEAFNTRILFTGDSESDQEEVYAPLVGDVDIFKLGHHGSKNGTSTTLLETITPEIAIITNGDYLGNQYKHPTYEAISRIYEYSNLIPVYAVTGGNGSDSYRNLQRNGDITITISLNGYEITSQYYLNNPLELSATDYWNDINNPYRDLKYYYANASGILDESDLRLQLHEIIDDHTVKSYDYAKTAFLTTEEDPNNPNNVLLFYTGLSQDKNTFGGGVNDYNREHVWAQSHGIDKALPAYSDLHHLRATNVWVNSQRGDLDFGNVIHNNDTLVNTNYGDVSSYCYKDDYYFEPRDEIKGDIARMLFYMAIRYEGDGEPDLELVNGTTTSDSNNLGDLATLLEWHMQDPVDDWERNRNNLVYYIQGNRNPFIDLPELALLIFNE